jgi:hypothetical protein
MLSPSVEPMGGAERWRGTPMRGGRLVVTLWGRQWRQDELLARVGRLEQVAGVRLTEGGDGAERGVRLLRCSTGAGFEFEILVDRGFDIGGAWLGGRPLAWASPVGLAGPHGLVNLPSFPADPPRPVRVDPVSSWPGVILARRHPGPASPRFTAPITRWMIGAAFLE